MPEFTTKNFFKSFHKQKERLTVKYGDNTPKWQGQKEFYFPFPCRLFVFNNV